MRTHGDEEKFNEKWFRVDHCQVCEMCSRDGGEDRSEAAVQIKSGDFYLLTQASEKLQEQTLGPI